MSEDLRVVSISRRMLENNWLQRIPIDLARSFGEAAVQMSLNKSVRMHLIRRQDLRDLRFGADMTHEKLRSGIVRRMPESFHRRIYDVPVVDVKPFSLRQHPGSVAVVFAEVAPTDDLLAEHEAALSWAGGAGANLSRSPFVFQVGLCQMQQGVVSSAHTRAIRDAMPETLQFAAGSVHITPRQ